MRDIDREVSPRGEGNVVSIEFNLLYRWHATVSEPDVEWTEKRFEQLMNGVDMRTVGFSLTSRHSGSHPFARSR